MRAIATSRTGTAKYKNLTRRMLHTAQQAGLTHCPCTADCRAHKGRPCSVPLDYINRRRPNGASIDHIIPVAQGGQDRIENTQVRCLYCNTATGDKRSHRAMKQHIPTTTATTTGRRPGRPA